MSSANVREARNNSSRSIAAWAALACLISTLPSPLSAQSGGERWLGTWATSEVARPQTPPTPVQGPPPVMRTECPAGNP